MTTILTAICTTLGTYLAKNIVSISDTAKEVFKYLNMKMKSEKEKTAAEKLENAENLVDEACDSGSLDDLLNATEELGKAR